MKNIFLSELKQNLNEYSIEGETAHHFKNVLRGKVHDTLKVFNGRGLSALAEVVTLGKREMSIKCHQIKSHPPKKSLKLILGIPKKEYLESVLRSCIQIGLHDITLVTTQYTPWKFKYYDRLDKIQRAAIIQSENPYLPDIKVRKNLPEALHQESLTHTIAFVTELDSPKEISQRADSFLIGPEGGFSRDELSFLQSLKHCSSLKCPTPLMKTETAVPFCAGLLHNQYLIS